MNTRAVILSFYCHSVRNIRILEKSKQEREMEWKNEVNKEMIYVILSQSSVFTFVSMGMPNGTQLGLICLLAAIIDTYWICIFILSVYISIAKKEKCETRCSRGICYLARGLEITCHAWVLQQSFYGALKPSRNDSTRLYRSFVAFHRFTGLFARWIRVSDGECVSRMWNNNSTFFFFWCFVRFGSVDFLFNILGATRPYSGFCVY